MDRTVPLLNAAFGFFGSRTETPPSCALSTLSTFELLGNTLNPLPSTRILPLEDVARELDRARADCTPLPDDALFSSALCFSRILASVTPIALHTRVFPANGLNTSALSVSAARLFALSRFAVGAAGHISGVLLPGAMYAPPSLPTGTFTCPFPFVLSHPIRLHLSLNAALGTFGRNRSRIVHPMSDACLNAPVPPSTRGVPTFTGGAAAPAPRDRNRFSAAAAKAPLNIPERLTEAVPTLR